MEISHILLVDDDLDTLHAFRMLLERRGFVITIAQTIDEAQELVKDCKFDLVVTDLAFPIESGYALLKEMRTHSDVPAIAVTAHGQLKDRKQVFNAGFNAHVLKPVNADELERVISKALTGELMIEPVDNDGD
jgi:DNA-binding response OmpR family regulator